METVVSVWTICYMSLALTFSAQKADADGYEHARFTQCLYSSTELSDMEYIDSYIFNKVEHIRFNSTVGQYVGYTEHGIKNAERWNENPSLMASERAALERYCKHNAENHYSAVLDKTVKPYVRLRSLLPSGGRHSAMLMCSAYSFYPKPIRVTWQRNGQSVTSDVTSTEVLPDGDWFYQVHSHLEYTPRSGEQISCMVEHASLDRPLVVDWNPSLPESERSKIAIGASGLVLGMILALAGFIYYKKKSRGVL